MKLIHILFALLSCLSAALGKQGDSNSDVDPGPGNRRKSDILGAPLLFTPYLLLSHPAWVAGIVSAYGLTALLPGGQAFLRPIVQEPYWASYELQHTRGCKPHTFPPNSYEDYFFATATTRDEPDRSDIPTPTVLHVSRTTPSTFDMIVSYSDTTISPHRHTSSSLRTASSSQPSPRLTESSPSALTSAAVQLTITGASTCPSEDLPSTSITTSPSPRTSLSPSGTADSTLRPAIERTETSKHSRLPPYIHVGAKFLGNLIISFYISLAIYAIPIFTVVLLKGLWARRARRFEREQDRRAFADRAAMWFIFIVVITFVIVDYLVHR